MTTTDRIGVYPFGKSASEMENNIGKLRFVGNNVFVVGKCLKSGIKHMDCLGIKRRVNIEQESCQIIG